MNTHVFETTLINLKPNEVPSGLRIGFQNVLTNDAIIKIESAVSYWCGSKAITDGENFSIVWLSEDTLIVTADFESGYFLGNLTYRNALIEGDKKFTLGLVSLFRNGHLPRTRHGQRIEPCVVPLYIECLYDESLTISQGVQTMIRNEVDLKIKNLLLYLSKQL